MKTTTVETAERDKHRVLALIYAVPGVGWAVATLAVLLYHQERGELPMSIVDVLIGVWLWQGRRRGAVLAFVMAPVSFALGWLFALPYLIVMAPLRAIAVVVARRELRR